ncbi:MAG TPA: MBL fold metallo-hydrolase [Dehalococcoidia bacterium]|nr:MBL fold metallo-hydrolase [Dehalococcoidia bacterium]
MACEIREITSGLFQIRFQGKSDPSSPMDGPSASQPYVAWFLAGPSAAIIEPGPTVMARLLPQAIRDLGYDPQAVEMVVATHIHVDHAGGLGYLARELPRARFAVHHRGARHVAEPARLVAGTAAFFGPDWEADYGPIEPVPGDRLLALDDGQALELGGRRHRVIYTPGHAFHHVSFYDEEEGLIYCGEALGFPLPMHGTAPAAVTPTWDQEAALASLDRLGRLASQAICYSHIGETGIDPRLAIEGAEKATRDMADIVRQALAQGAGREEIGRRLRLYAFSSADYPWSFDAMIAGFEGYFRRLQEEAERA